jgi:hypothetical protein
MKAGFRAEPLAEPRVKLLLLMALFASPALAAWLAYAYWQPDRFTNYGTLLPPQALGLPPLLDEAGTAVEWSGLRGSWVLLVTAPHNCEARCGHDSFLAHQVRLAQGREQGRIVRVFLGTGGEGTWPHGDGAYRVTMRPLPVALAGGGLFLVDPLGRLMMAFPPRADGERVIRDLKQLLRASGAG